MQIKVILGLSKCDQILEAGRIILNSYAVKKGRNITVLTTFHAGINSSSCYFAKRMGIKIKVKDKVNVG